MIDDSNFHSAIDLWFDNQAEAPTTDISATGVFLGDGYGKLWIGLF